MAEYDRVRKAILDSLQMEKEAGDFYAMCARSAESRDCRRLFDLLAKEEREHAETFYRICSDVPMTFSEYMATAPRADSPWLASFGQFDKGFSESEAMRFAMEREQELEQTHREMAEGATDPTVKGVYELNARETRNHLEVIAAEYSRHMGMLSEADLDSFRE